MRYKKFSVLITGASQGIGRSIALTFAAQTDKPLLLVARSTKNLEETKKLCMEAGADKVAVLVCDATDSFQTSRLKVPEGFPDPDVIINNAGSYLYKPLADTSNTEFAEQINVNLFTAVNIVNRFMAELRKMNRALIINICSVGATVGLAESGAYSAAKHALLGYTRSLRQELLSTEIGVTAINLGQTHSTSWDESDMSPQKLIDPKDVSALILTLTDLSPRTLVEEILIQPQHGRVAPM